MSVYNSPGASEAAPRSRLPAFALLAASTVSGIGSAFTYIALPWFVLQTTGSASKTGLTGFFVALPGFIAGMFGGTIVDKLGFKYSSIVCDLVSALGIMSIPFLYDTFGLSFWQILVFVFIGSLLEIPGVTARRSLLPELAGLARMRLEQVNSLFESIQALALLIGPPAAGILIGVLKAGNVLWIDGASFIFSAVVVAIFIPLIKAEAPEKVAGAVAKSGRYFDDLKAGLRFLRADRLLFGMAICVGLSNFLSSPLYSVVLPVWVDHFFGDATILGLLSAFFGAAMLTGALGYGFLGHRVSRRALWILSFLAAPPALWTLGLTHTLFIVIPMAMISGLFSGPVNPLMVTVRHERIPIEMRARVFATFSAITAVAAPLGMVIAGILTDRLGIDGILLLMALLNSLLALSMPLLPFVRDFDTSRPAEITDAEERRIAPADGAGASAETAQ